MKFPLSPKQLLAYTQSDAKINIYEGSVRSGKSYVAQLALLDMLRLGPPGKYIVCGKTERTVVQNIIDPINEEEPGLIRYNRALGRFELFGKICLVVGASDERSEGKIRGVTLNGGLVDELTILPQSFFRQLTYRCSPADSKLVCTTNPDSPFHYVKTDFIDNKDGFTKSFKFTLDDNPSLSHEYKEFIKSTNKGLWYQRFVLGEWVLAEGAIYDFFEERYHVAKNPPTYAKYYLLGIDYGTKNAFAAVLIGFNDDHHPTLWVEKEYYWDSEKAGYQKTDSEYCRAIQEAFEGYPIRMAYLDPSAQSFEVELRRAKIPVKQAKNDVIDGIRFVASLFTNGDLVVCKACANVIKEIQSYVWDVKSAKDGVDRPLKQRDHSLDAMRYALFTHYGELSTLKVNSKEKNWQEQQKRKWIQNPMDYPGMSPGSFGWQRY